MAAVLRRVFSNFQKISQFSLPRLASTVPTPYEIVDTQEERKKYQGISSNQCNDRDDTYKTIFRNYR